ncbi:MAG: protein kinase domain-containing protein, partial [Armatimonadota bacterium]
MIGTTVGTRFHIVGRIGEGWLFTVYRAKDLLTGQLVAVKVMRPTLAIQRPFVEALLQTFEQHIHLAHPSLVRYLAVGETEERIPFVTCELVAGHALTQLLQRRLPLPIHQALDLLSQVADGVNYLHHMNAVHGDIRPHNILVTPRGEVKVGDYGLWSVFLSSRVVETEWLERAAPYLAPERFQGERATPQSDVYSLGVVLFQMLTGHLPFEAAHISDLAHLHLTAPVPLASSLNPSIPFALDAILLRAMAKDPSQRFANAGELRNAIQEVLATLEAEKVAMPSAPEPPTPTEAIEEREALSVWQRFMQSALGLIFGLIIGLVAVSGVIYSLLVGTKPNEVVVPDVTGMKLPQAQQILAERNLKLRVVRWGLSQKVTPEPIKPLVSPAPKKKGFLGGEVVVVGG